MGVCARRLQRKTSRPLRGAARSRLLTATSGGRGATWHRSWWMRRATRRTGPGAFPGLCLARGGNATQSSVFVICALEAVLHRRRRLRRRPGARIQERRSLFLSFLFACGCESWCAVRAAALPEFAAAVNDIRSGKARSPGFWVFALAGSWACAGEFSEGQLGGAGGGEDACHGDEGVRLRRVSLCFIGRSSTPGAF